MSREFAVQFFPSLSSVVQASPGTVRDVWDTLFPLDVAEACTVPIYDDSAPSYVPHRPCTFLAALLGMYVGLGSGHGRGRKPTRENAGVVEAFSKSTKAFGLMNLTAIFHHSIFPPSQKWSSQGLKDLIDLLLWSADCIFTGVSCSFAIEMAVLLYALHLGTNTDDERIRQCVFGSQVMLSAIISVYLVAKGSIDPSRAVGTSIELFYLLPLATAATAVLPLVARTIRKTSGASISLLGMGIILVGIISDAPICRYISQQNPSLAESPFLFDAFHLATFVFFGCDVIFIGLSIWLDEILTQGFPNDKKEE